MTELEKEVIRQITSTSYDTRKGGVFKGKSFDEMKEIINSLSDYVKCILIKEDPGFYKYIDNPTEEMNLLIIRHSWYDDDSAFQYVKNPSETLKFYAISKAPRLIKYIDNPSEELVLMAVERWPEAIKYVKHPSRDAVIMVAKKNASMLGYVKDLLDEEILMIAAKESGVWDTLELLKDGVDLPEKVLRYCIKKQPHMISLVERPSTKICWVALKEDANAISEMNTVDTDIILYALSNASSSCIKSFIHRITQAGRVNELSIEAVLALQVSGYKLFGLRKVQ